jgi:hypothetical protein
MKPTKQDPSKPSHTVMKTSVTIPFDVWSAAKALSATERRELSDIVTEGLRLVLKARPGAATASSASPGRPTFEKRKAR